MSLERFVAEYHNFGIDYFFGFLIAICDFRKKRLNRRIPRCIAHRRPRRCWMSMSCMSMSCEIKSKTNKKNEKKMLYSISRNESKPQRIGKAGFFFSDKNPFIWWEKKHILICCCDSFFFVSKTTKLNSNSNNL